MEIEWPPQVTLVTPLGYLHDNNGNSYPRDIGRSTQLANGTVIIQFGDTFSHNRAGQCVGLTSNTIAVGVHRLCPTLSCYVPQDPTITSYTGEEKITPFIKPYDDEEDMAAIRHTMWPFGGIIERPGSPPAGLSYGWVFFEKSRHDLILRQSVYEYTGLAQVVVDISGRHPRINAYRNPQARALFDRDEPKLGTFAAVADNIYLYAYGHIDPHHRDVGVGRVPIISAHRRSDWSYWGGNQWTRDIKNIQPVIRNMKHGQIWKTKMFGGGSEWAFIGNNSFSDSKVMIGRSKKLEGPFQIQELMQVKPLCETPSGSFAYCMYPHPWAFNIEHGDLMITWSEGSMYGNIVAAKVRFALTTKDDGNDGNDEDA